MEINVLNIKGQETGRKVTLNDAIFGIEPNDHVIYLDVKQYLANQRQGTAKAKERSEHAGSTRKLGRQKGGGGARHGDINSPLLKGGGRVFGPTPRDYGFKLNKKVKALARKSALSYKAQENAIIVVEDFTFEAPKTKDFLAIVQNLKVADKNLLLLTPESDKNVYLSVRNLRNGKKITVGEPYQDKKGRRRRLHKSVCADVMPAAGLNTYKVLNADVLLITESSLKTIDGVLAK